MKLPKDWKRTEIGAVASINERSLSSATKPDFKFRYLELSAVNQGRINYPDRYTLFKDAPSRARRLVQDGDVLMSMVRPNLQGFARLEKAPDDLVVSTGFAVITPTEMDSAFLYQSLFSHRVTAQFARLLTGSGYPALNSSDIEELVITAPIDIDEQKKIADIFGTWDQVLEILDALIEAKARLKKALLQQLLEGKRRLPGYTATWRNQRIGELLKSADRYEKWNDDRTYRLAGVRRNAGGLFFRGDLGGGEIKVKTCKKICNGDFLISRRQITYGGMAIVPPEFDGFDVNDEYEVLTVKDPLVFDIRFFNYLSQTPKLKQAAYLASNGFFAERLRLNFDLPAFLDHKIRVPTTLKEQQNIVGVLDTASEEIRLLRSQRDALARQKRGLMQRLLTGKMKVKTK